MVEARAEIVNLWLRVRRFDLDGRLSTELVHKHERIALPPAAGEISAISVLSGWDAKTQPTAVVAARAASVLAKVSGLSSSTVRPVSGSKQWATWLNQTSRVVSSVIVPTVEREVVTVWLLGSRSRGGILDEFNLGLVPARPNTARTSRSTVAR